VKILFIYVRKATQKSIWKETVVTESRNDSCCLHSNFVELVQTWPALDTLGEQGVGADSLEEAASLGSSDDSIGYTFFNF
jgi:hypothetical protein